METIINQITASQGLSAVAVLALFNLLFLIIYAFFIGKAFDRIKDYEVVLYQNVEQLELLKKSHSEINQKFVSTKTNLLDEVSFKLSQRDKKVNEFEKQLLEAIEAGKARDLKTRIQIENANKRIKDLIDSKKADKVAEAKKELAETLEKKTKQPKFKAGDKVKTNTGSFKGVIVDRIFENKKFLYLVSNKSNGSQRWFSETTLRFQ